MPTRYIQRSVTPLGLDGSTAAPPDVSSIGVDDTDGKLKYSLEDGTVKAPVIDGGTISDSTVIGDNGDTTKSLKFELSGATTAKRMTIVSSQTLDRSITLPDATTTLVGQDTTDSLSNKTLVTPVIGVATGTSLAVTGLLKSSGTAGVGYATGAGGVVTQGSSKSTTVALAKITGAITMHNASLSDATNVKFTVTNALVAAGDMVIVNHASAGTSGAYQIWASGIVAATSFDINVRNVSGGALGEAIVLNYAVIKGVSA